jgi:hypothetical protein
LSSPAPEQLRRWLETMRQCLIDRPYQPQLGGELTPPYPAMAAFKARLLLPTESRWD